MPDTTPSTVTTERRRFSIRLPRPLWIRLATVMVVVAACQRDSTSPSLSAQPQAEKAPEQTIKVLVTANGEIVADRHPVTLDQLSARLTELEQAGGHVWYYRENPSAEPHMNAMKVIDLVAQNRLPIRLSSKPDFSAFVDAKDIPRTRFQYYEQWRGGGKVEQ